MNTFKLYITFALILTTTMLNAQTSNNKSDFGTGSEIKIEQTNDQVNAIMILDNVEEMEFYLIEFAIELNFEKENLEARKFKRNKCYTKYNYRDFHKKS